MKYYKTNIGDRLSDERFRSPDTEYRGAPFWAWNSVLDPEVLCEQIDVFKEMGLTAKPDVCARAELFLNILQTRDKVTHCHLP